MIFIMPEKEFEKNLPAARRNFEMPYFWRELKIDPNPWSRREMSCTRYF
jgi:hypothetical protein